jgi:hypothetical protein
MRMIVEVRFEPGVPAAAQLYLDRADADLPALGLTLEEGRRLTQFVQESLARRRSQASQRALFGA